MIEEATPLESIEGRTTYNVGTGSVLNNPFNVTDDEEQSLSMYKNWLNIQWTTGNGNVIGELRRLAMILKEEKTIILSCTTVPSHSEIVYEAITTLINRALV